jgi:hypothetical protein
MKKLIIWGFVVLAYTSLWGQRNMFSPVSKDPNKRRSSQPALPYGPKERGSWYKSRAFEETDFPAPSEFELRRLETENLRHEVIRQQEELPLTMPS